ncbi:hypothetical protein BACAU_1065 [Bacillus sp. CN2]|nr:hypothetical protein BACAU_1065 [Bacillus sp. CN2]
MNQNRCFLFSQKLLWPSFVYHPAEHTYFIEIKYSDIRTDI